VVCHMVVILLYVTCVKGFMVCLDVVDVYLWGSSWSFVDVMCVLLACKYVITFSSCLCPFVWEKCCVLYVVVVKDFINIVEVNMRVCV
jgi:hypothetical protein